MENWTEFFFFANIRYKSQEQMKEDSETMTALNQCYEWMHNSLHLEIMVICTKSNYKCEICGGNVNFKIIH